jgi:hypothetical protein
MAREKIEIANGSIAPTQRGLWSSAIEKLQEAEIGLQQMEQASDRIGFEQGWTRAVDSIAEFWTRFFDEGKKTFSNFQPWAGALKAQWESDELMMYLYQARHQSQHGRISFEWEEGKYHIAPGFNGHIKDLNMFGDGTFSMSSTPSPGSQVKAKIRFEGGHARLPTIMNTRTDQKQFHPPKQHLGQAHQDVKPEQAVRLGIAFYMSVLESAFAKFAPGNGHA